jgi:hypothetical protein
MTPAKKAPAKSTAPAKKRTPKKAPSRTTKAKPAPAEQAPQAGWSGDRAADLRDDYERLGQLLKVETGSAAAAIAR